MRSCSDYLLSLKLGAFSGEDTALVQRDSAQKVLRLYFRSVTGNPEDRLDVGVVVQVGDL